MSTEPMYPPSFSGIIALLRRLRDPDDGCPWDQEQTPRSLLPHLLEEAHEAAEAIEAGDPEAIVDELGDLMLHLAYQIAIAQEQNAFDVSDVAGHVIDKMVRRHPHVFGDAEFAGDGHQSMWERLKRDEKRDGESSVLGDLPSGLPALVRAYRLQQKAAAIGFDWPSPDGARAKIDEELEEAMRAADEGNTEATEEELGDLLFAVVNWGRLLDLHPHNALLAASRKFELRFRRLEALARQRGIDVEAQPLDVLDELWEDAKRAERA